MKTFGIIALILLGIFLIGIGPVLTIISLNAVFGLAIGITIWNWLAVLWLTMIVAANKVKFNSK
jgi:hypothetical protein